MLTIKLFEYIIHRKTWNTFTTFKRGVNGACSIISCKYKFHFLCCWFWPSIHSWCSYNYYSLLSGLNSKCEFTVRFFNFGEMIIAVQHLISIKCESTITPTFICALFWTLSTKRSFLVPCVRLHRCSLWIIQAAWCLFIMYLYSQNKSL